MTDIKPLTDEELAELRVSALIPSSDVWIQKSKTLMRRLLATIDVRVIEEREACAKVCKDEMDRGVIGASRCLRGILGRPKPASGKELADRFGFKPLSEQEFMSNVDRESKRSK